MRKVETLMGVIILLALTALLAVITINGYLRAKPATPTPQQPSGVWAGLVDDLPSGRMVECVFARDPSGSVAVTCDWANAVRGRP